MAGEGLLKSAKGFYRLTLLRQLGLMAGLAASIALGFQVILWSKDPNFRPLYSQLTPQQTSEVLDTLQENAIKYKIDRHTGSVLVPSSEVYNARFKTAGVGMPGNNNVGFESLEKDSGLGTSRFMESARYKRALEGELAKTITSLKNVNSARVHLAIPKEAVFVNDKQKPTASVFLDLASNNGLSKKQVSAIQQLVAASIPNLGSNEVSVVDNNGNLLSINNLSDEFNVSNERLEYLKHVEKNYENSVINLLAPLVGRDNVKASVSVSADFTHFEKTEENFIPNKESIRSESVVNEINKEDEAGGVPGALTNAAPKSAATKKDKPEIANILSGLKTRQSTRNYEVGKAISHSKHHIGNIQRLTIGVVLDNLQKIDKEGKETSIPLTKEEIENITTLVKNAVGFDAERGDQISVVNIPFVKKAEPVADAPLPLWKQDWVIDLAKKVSGVVFLLILVFFVLRPILKMLANKETLVKQGEYLPADGGPPMQLSEGQYPGQLDAERKPAAMSDLQQMADEDPKKIALVMKNWVGDNK